MKAKIRTWRRRVHETLELGASGDLASRLFDAVLIILVLSNAAAFTLGTVPWFEQRYQTQLYWFEVISVSIFTVEYIARLWSCVEVPTLRDKSPLQARLHYATHPLLLIDLLVIAPFFLSFLLPVDFRILRILWLLRLLKLARYSPALQTLALVLHTERRALFGALLVMLCLLLFASTGIYYIERHVQPDVFGSVPASMWWSLSTLTTVGYGDVVPLTPLGRLFGGLIMLFGLGMFALPIGIIATGFSQESSRRDFVISWSLVASVPFFAKLDISDIATIMPMLNSSTYQPHELIVSRGDVAHSMYFIASGSVAVETEEGEVSLCEGDYFGEMALIDGRRREHTVRAKTKCRLLELDARDYHWLLQDRPDLREAIAKTARERSGNTKE